MSDTHSGLRAEVQRFEASRRAWLPEHNGQYVVMCMGEVAGFFDDYGAGLRAGIARFGVANEFLIRRVYEDDAPFVV